MKITAGKRIHVLPRHVAIIEQVVYVPANGAPPRSLRPIHTAAMAARITDGPAVHGVPAVFSYGLYEGLQGALVLDPLPDTDAELRILFSRPLEEL